MAGRRLRPQELEHVGQRIEITPVLDLFGDDVGAGSPIVTVAGKKVKRMNLNVPVPLHNACKATTAACGQNMTDELMKFIESYVAKYSPKGRRQ